MMRWYEPKSSRDDGPPTIKNHSVTFFKEYLYCFGGYDGCRNHKTLLLYSVRNQTWIQPKVLDESSVSGQEGESQHAGLVASSVGSMPRDLDGSILGSSPTPSSRTITATSSSSSPLLSATTTTTTTTIGSRVDPEVLVIGTPPPGRNGHTATLATDPEDDENGRILIIGGWLGTGPLAASDMHVLDVSSGHDRHSLRWYQPAVKGTPPGPCNMHSADYVSSLREVFVFRGGNGREYLNDLHALDVDTYVWRKVETTGQIPQQRANHSSAVLVDTGELFIFGGWNGKERLNDIHVLDTATSTWTCPHIGGVLPHPRAGMTLTALRGRLYLFGGSGTSSKCFQDLHILDREEMAWLDIARKEKSPISKTSYKGSNESHQDANNHSHNRSPGDRNINDVDCSGSASDLEAQRLTGKHQSYQRYSYNRVGAGNLRRDFPISSPNPNDEATVPSILVEGDGPGRRAGHTATAVNRNIFVFGGSCGSDYLNDFFVLDTDPLPQATVSEPTSLQLFQNTLHQFYNNQEFSDVTFLVEGQKVYGHKMVLSAVSDCFRAMFTTGFRESEAGAEIKMPNCSFHAFLAMMDYIYSGQSPQIDVSLMGGEAVGQIVDLLELADQFFLDHLKQSCEQILQPAINEETVEYLLQIALKTNSSQLLSICEHFQRNQDRV